MEPLFNFRKSNLIPIDNANSTIAPRKIAETQLMPEGSGILNSLEIAMSETRILPPKRSVNARRHTILQQVKNDDLTNSGMISNSLKNFIENSIISYKHSPAPNKNRGSKSQETNDKNYREKIFSFSERKDSMKELSHKASNLTLSEHHKTYDESLPLKPDINPRIRQSSIFLGEMDLEPQGFAVNELISAGVSSPDVNMAKYKSLKKEMIHNTPLKCFQNNKERIIKSLKNVNDSMSEEEDVEEYIDEKSKWVINDESFVKRMWDLLMMVLILYSVTVDPYRLSFSNDEHIGVDPFIFFEISVDFLFLIDLVLNFITPYYSEDRKVENVRQISMKYFSTWFFLDFLASFPSSLITYFLDSSNNSADLNKLKSLLKLSRMYRLIRWVRIFRLFRIAKNDSKGQMVSDIKLNSDSSINRLVKFSFIFLLLSHIATCIWVYIAQQEAPDYSWIMGNKLQDSSNVDLYIASLYFNIVTIFTIGYGDITARTSVEKIYNSFFMFGGVLLYSLAISSLSTIFIKLDDIKIKIKKKITILNDIDKEYKIPEDLKEKIEKTTKFLAKKVNLEKFELLDILPYTLKKEVVLKLNRKGISKVSFFKNQDRDFLIYALPLLRSLKLKQGDILISVGDYIDEMYIISRGVLAIKLESFFKNMEVGHVKSSGHFGDILMYLNENSPYLVSCKSGECESMVLKKADFLKMKSYFNDNILNILKLSCRMLENIQKKKAFVIALFNLNQTFGQIKLLMKRLELFCIKFNFQKFLEKELNYDEAIDFILSHEIEDVIEMLSTDINNEEVFLKFLKKKLIESKSGDEEDRDRKQSMANEFFDITSNSFVDPSNKVSFNNIINTVKEDSPKINKKEFNDDRFNLKIKHKTQPIKRQLFLPENLATIKSEKETKIDLDKTKFGSVFERKISVNTNNSNSSSFTSSFFDSNNSVDNKDCLSEMDLNGKFSKVPVSVRDITNKFVIPQNIYNFYNYGSSFNHNYFVNSSQQNPFTIDKSITLEITGQNVFHKTKLKIINEMSISVNINQNNSTFITEQKLPPAKANLKFKMKANKQKTVQFVSNNNVSIDTRKSFITNKILHKSESNKVNSLSSSIVKIKLELEESQSDLIQYIKNRFNLNSDSRKDVNKGYSNNVLPVGVIFYKNKAKFYLKKLDDMIDMVKNNTSNNINCSNT